MLTRIRLPAKLPCHMYNLWLVSCTFLLSKIVLLKQLYKIGPWSVHQHCSCLSPYSAPYYITINTHCLLPCEQTYPNKLFTIRNTTRTYIRGEIPCWQQQSKTGIQILGGTLTRWHHLVTPGGLSIWRKIQHFLFTRQTFKKSENSHPWYM